MSVIVVGLNHRSAPLSLLERVAVPGDEAGKVLASLVELDHVLEAVVLSTCNRVEVYAHVARFHPGLQEVRAWLAERADLEPSALDDAVYTQYDDRAAAHLFDVVAGLDSMIVGERQIALQVKQAAELARDEGASRRVLQKLFREALRVGRRVRNETQIASGASSMVDVALDAAARRWDDGLAGRSVVIVGAGKIGGLTADRLADEPVAGVRVWNRSDDKARRLADRIGAEVVEDGRLTASVADADLVVCTTGAAVPVLDMELVTEATRDRRDRQLVLVDLAVPRNVEPAVTDLDGVEVIDVSDVREVARSTVAADVLQAAHEIVEEEAARFDAWTRAVQIEPTVRALRARAEAVREAELERLAGRLGALDDKQRKAVEALAQGIVNTLLHEPTVRLKELAHGGGAEHYAQALRELFDLDE